MDGSEQEAAGLHRVGVRTAAAKRLSLSNFEQTAVVRLWELGMGARLRELEARAAAAAVRLYLSGFERTAAAWFCKLAMAAILKLAGFE